MSRIEIVPIDTPFGERLVAGFGTAYLVPAEINLPLCALLHRHHERSDMESEAPRLAMANGQDDDSRLIDAARLLGTHTDQRDEAGALLERLADHWPEHPLRAEIDALRRQLAGAA